MANTFQADTNLITEAIKNGVKNEVSRRFDEHKKTLIEQLDKDKDMIVSGIVLNITKYIQMDTATDNLVITIRKIEI